MRERNVRKTRRAMIVPTVEATPVSSRGFGGWRGRRKRGVTAGPEPRVLRVGDHPWPRYITVFMRLLGTREIPP
jgi:hypothetical protein